MIGLTANHESQLIWQDLQLAVSWLPLLHRDIVDRRGPNTGDLVLSPAAGGGRKPLQLALMADRWVDNPTQREECKQVMDREGILPALPAASTHGLGDSCNPWPPIGRTKTVD
jgi:hypothetical protein